MPKIQLEPRQLRQIVLAILLLGWRLLSHPLTSLWRDWIFILGVYWLYTALASRSRAWPQVTAATMAFLLGIYIHGQTPYALSVLGLAP
jgi:hypothetical protein